MTIQMAWVISIVGALISAMIASSFVMWVEHIRKPKLNLKIGKFNKHEYDERLKKPARIMRTFGLDLGNENLHKCLRWMSRNAAVHCSGYITFHKKDGDSVFSRPMPIKWSRMPMFEVRPMGARIEHSPYEVSFIDVHPGECETLDVISRFDNDNECYGWNNESYYSDPPWRNKDWRLDGSYDYFIKVRVISAGLRCEDVFKLHIGNDPDDLRLEELDNTNKERILKIPEFME